MNHITEHIRDWLENLAALYEAPSTPSPDSDDTSFNESPAAPADPGGVHADGPLDDFDWFYGPW